MNASCFYAWTRGNGSEGLGYERICILEQVASSRPLPEVALATSEEVEDVAHAFSVATILICTFLIFWMQAGFSVLEAGTLRPKNSNNILFKNITDATCGAIGFWLLGYTFAFGNDNTGSGHKGDDNVFIGVGNLAMKESSLDNNDYHIWFFQWAFASTAATIVSGCTAERCRLEAYICCSIFITVFIYPVVVHWVWSKTGFLSPYYTDTHGERLLKENGVIDVAGAGAVHTVGGFAGLVGAIFLGPRIGFGSEKLRGPNDMLTSLGSYILITGWFAFNLGSAIALGVPGIYNLASKSAFNSVIAMASATFTCTLTSRLYFGNYRLDFIQNNALAGMVAITAGCSVVEPWGAFCIGVIASFVFWGTSTWLRYSLCIDDPLDAFAVHGACGIWGMLTPGIFGTRSGVMLSYGFDNNAIESGNQFRNQLIGIACIVTWTTAMSTLLFGTLRWLGMLRVTEKLEKAGLDMSMHGTPFRRGFAVLDFTWEQVKAIRTARDS